MRFAGPEGVFVLVEKAFLQEPVWNLVNEVENDRVDATEEQSLIFGAEIHD